MTVFCLTPVVFIVFTVHYYVAHVFFVFFVKLLSWFYPRHYMIVFTHVVFHLQ